MIYTILDKVERQLSKRYFIEIKFNRTEGSVNIDNEKVILQTPLEDYYLPLFCDVRSKLEAQLLSGQIVNDLKNRLGFNVYHQVLSDEIITKEMKNHKEEELKRDLDKGICYGIKIGTFEPRKTNPIRLSLYDIEKENLGIGNLKVGVDYVRIKEQDFKIISIQNKVNPLLTVGQFMICVKLEKGNT